MAMPFWNVRRGTSPDSSQGSVAHDLTPTLQPIQLFTATKRIEGWIIAAEERVTDLLNRHESIRVCVDAATDVWETVSHDDLLLVAPPTHYSNPQRRVHRSKQRLMALVGPYVVSGVAHLAPGTTPDPYLLRTRQQFLPMTNASVTHRTDPDVDYEFPVVIVNVSNLTDLHALLAPV
jgi:hypothetical protein